LLSSLVDGSKYRIIENNVKGKVRKKMNFFEKSFERSLFDLINFLFDPLYV
jgi:hypothetical protein